MASIVRQVVEEFEHLAPQLQGLVHGDLIPANLLFTDGAAPGEIDFGFQRTYGDPDFDVAITPAIFDMYGPDAKRITRVLTRALADRLAPGRN